MSQLVIFDFDDTIVDTQTALLAARKAALYECFGERITECSLFKVLDIWRRLGSYFPPGSFETMAQPLATECGWEIPVTDNVFRGQRALIEGEITNLRPIAGIVRVFDEINKRQIKCGLLSNGDSSHQLRKLESSGLRGYFDKNLVLIAKPGSRFAKPSGEGILELCRRTKISPVNTIYVGDRLSDVVAGRLAKCKMVYFYRLATVARPRIDERGLSLEVPTFGLSRIEDLISLLDTRHETSSITD